jgi:hypothetical protein
MFDQLFSTVQKNALLLLSVTKLNADIRRYLHAVQTRDVKIRTLGKNQSSYDK